MSTTELHDALDALAHLADHDVVPDRLAGIVRRRRAQRNRRAVAGAGVAALAVIATSVGIATVPGGGGDADGQVATPAPTPSAPAPRLEVALQLRPAGQDTYRVSYRLTGTALAVRDPATGDPVAQGGPLGTRVLLDGKDVGGTDGGSVECDPAGRVETYDQTFGPVEVRVEPGEMLE